MRRRGGELWIGAVIWLAVAVGLGGLVQAHAAGLSGPLGKLRRYLFERPGRVQAELAGPLAVGDPVLDSDRRYLGRVVTIHADATAALSTASVIATWQLPLQPHYAVTLALDPEAEVPADARFATRSAPLEGQWVLETLLPAHKRELISRELSAFLDAHEPVVTGFVRPVAEDVIAHAMQVLEANLTAALRRREKEIQALLGKHQVLLREEIVPVLKRRLGPSAKKKADPILREIGRELWVELPMWSLGWNAFVDSLPGTDDTRLDKRWSDFVDDKAIPILVAHEAELLDALGQLIEEGARDPEVRASLAGATERLAADPEFKALVRAILEEALIRPFEVRALAERVLKDPGHRARLQELSDAFGPTLQRIARHLSVDAETGRIDPDLARVLRRVVFHKDARWVEWVPETPEKVEARPAKDPPAAPAPTATPGATERNF